MLVCLSPHFATNTGDKNRVEGGQAASGGAAAMPQAVAPLVASAASPAARPTSPTTCLPPCSTPCHLLSPHHYLASCLPASPHQLPPPVSSPHYLFPLPSPFSPQYLLPNLTVCLIPVTSPILDPSPHHVYPPSSPHHLSLSLSTHTAAAGAPWAGTTVVVAEGVKQQRRTVGGRAPACQSLPLCREVFTFYSCLFSALLTLPPPPPPPLSWPPPGPTLPHLPPSDTSLRVRYVRDVWEHVSHAGFWALAWRGISFVLVQGRASECCAGMRQVEGKRFFFFLAYNQKL